MKLAIQHHLLPGVTLTERFQRAAEFGFDGIELTAWGFAAPMRHHQDEIQAAVRASGVPISSLCTMRDDDYAHPDPVERDKRWAGLKGWLEYADELGAAGVVGLPIRNPLRFPDLSPVVDERTLITQMTNAAIRWALEKTPDTRAAMFLEPLNRYETHYLKTLSHAAELCRESGSERVRIMADLYHMNIEEVDLAASIRDNSTFIGHVHLADSNRLLPGHGHTDFVEPFRALRASGFEGWCALECSVPGEPTETLHAAVRFIRDAWEQAQ